MKQLLDCFKRGNKILLCGNGGSHAMANHFEEEMLCKFEKIRRPLPAISLKPLTSISNDFGYKYVFSRQIEALGKKGDILIVLSTSGRSKNCIQAIQTAHKIGLDVIELPRKGKTVSEIQEYQLRLIHTWCRYIEQAI